MCRIRMVERVSEPGSIRWHDRQSELCVHTRGPSCFAPFAWYLERVVEEVFPEVESLRATQALEAN